MVLNDIIEQAAGRQSQTPEQGGNVASLFAPFVKFPQVSSVHPYRKCIYRVSILPFDVQCGFFKNLPSYYSLASVYYFAGRF